MKRLAIALMLATAGAALLRPEPTVAQNIIQQATTTFSGTDFKRQNGVIGLLSPGGALVYRPRFLGHRIEAYAA